MPGKNGLRPEQRLFAISRYLRKMGETGQTQFTAAEIAATFETSEETIKRSLDRRFVKGNVLSKKDGIYYLTADWHEQLGNIVQNTGPSTGAEFAPLPFHATLIYLTNLGPDKNGNELDPVVRRFRMFCAESEFSRVAPSDIIIDTYGETIDWEMIGAWLEMERSINQFIWGNFQQFADLTISSVTTLYRNRQSKKDARFHDNLFGAFINRVSRYGASPLRPRVACQHLLLALVEIERQIKDGGGEIPRQWLPSFEICYFHAANRESK